MIISRFGLEGKTAIVTGASKGIGKACALGLAEAGADVVLASRNIDEIEKTAAEIRAKGQKAIPIKVDVLKEEEIEEMVKKTVDCFGKVDILLNNSGVGKISLVENLKVADWDWVIDTNLKGTFLCCKAVIPEMRKKKYGRIINMASLGGIRGSKNMGVYTASKGGIMRLSETLAIELVNDNITVNCVCPGMILTDMNEPYFLSERGKEELKKYPMKKPGNVEDVAGAVIYFASDAASYVTASYLVVDGGQRWKGNI